MIPVMPTKRRPGRPRQHGGRRAGAGRKPLPEGHTTVVSATLSAKHIEKVERWQEAHGCDTFSEALRQMIDAATPK